MYIYKCVIKLYKMTIKRVLTEFAGTTNMHGVRKLVSRGSVPCKIVWSLICVTAFSMFSMELGLVINKYYSYPKKVTIEMVQSTIPFPAISLCNMRNLDTVVLNTINKIFKESQNPDDWTSYKGDPFVEAYMSQVVKFFPMFTNPEIDIDVFQTILSRTSLATNIDQELVHKAGIPFKEFLVTCRFGTIPCNFTKDFTHFFDAYYYNCYTYKSGWSEDMDSILAEGLEMGWSSIVLSGSGMLDKNDDLRMIPGTHDPFSPMSSSEGVRVVIHHPDTEPYPHTEGFDVPAGYSATFGVKAAETIRIGEPHGNCSDVDPMKEEGSKYKYRLMTCQKKCLQKAIVEQCGCKNIHLPSHDHPKYTNVTYCSSDYNIPDSCRYEATKACVHELFRMYNRSMCVRAASLTFSRNATAIRECQCYPSCYELSYGVTYSLSRWPAESFDGDETYIDIFHKGQYVERFDTPEESEKYESYARYFNVSNRYLAMKQFARINVYVADGNVVKTVETADYSSSQLLSDIGGQLGLWIGISLITIVEIVELGYMLIKMTFGNKCPKFVPTKLLCIECGHGHSKNNNVRRVNGNAKTLIRDTRNRLPVVSLPEVQCGVSSRLTSLVNQRYDVESSLTPIMGGCRIYATEYLESCESCA